MANILSKEHLSNDEFGECKTRIRFSSLDSQQDVIAHFTSGFDEDDRVSVTEEGRGFEIYASHRCYCAHDCCGCLTSTSVTAQPESGAMVAIVTENVNV
jgi:hypothetical protein